MNTSATNLPLTKQEQVEQLAAMCTEEMKYAFEAMKRVARSKILLLIQPKQCEYEQSTFVRLEHCFGVRIL